jgi:hypothetical protein
MPRRITVADDWWDRFGDGRSLAIPAPGIARTPRPGFDPTRSAAVRAGMAYARSRGTHVGRPRTADPRRVLELTAQGYIPRAVADELGCSVDAVRRVLRKH